MFDFSSFLLYWVIFMMFFIPIKVRKNINKHIQNKSILADLLFYSYFVFLLSFTVLPTVKINLFDGFKLSLIFASGQIIDFSFFTIKAYSEWLTERTLQLKPFNTIIYYLNGNYANNIPPKVAFLRMTKNIIGNIVIFVPFGFLYPLRKSSGIIKTVGLGFGLTFLIECFQYIEGRVADIDDIFLNSFGVVLGYMAYVIYKRRGVKKNEKKS